MPSARVQCTHSRGSTNDSPLLPTIRSSSSPSSPQRRWSFMTLGPPPVPHQAQPGSAPSMRAGAAERPEPSLLSQLGLGRKDSRVPTLGTPCMAHRPGTGLLPAFPAPTGRPSKGEAPCSTDKTGVQRSWTRRPQDPTCWGSSHSHSLGIYLQKGTKVSF